MWLTFSYSALGLGVLLLIITIILSLKWDVVYIFDTVTGRKAKRMIQKYKERDERLGQSSSSLTSGLSPAMTGHMKTETLLEKSRKSSYKLKDSKMLIKSQNSESGKTGENIILNANTNRSKVDDGLNLKTEIIAEDLEVQNSELTQILDIDGQNDVEQGENPNNIVNLPVSAQSKENAQENEENGEELVQNAEATSILSEEELAKTQILSEEGSDKTQILSEEDESGKTSFLTEEGSDKTSILSFEEDEVQGSTQQLSSQPVVSIQNFVIKRRGNSYSK